MSAKLWRMPAFDTGDRQSTPLANYIESQMMKDIHAAFAFIGRQLLPVARKRFGRSGSFSHDKALFAVGDIDEGSRGAPCDLRNVPG